MWCIHHLTKVDLKTVTKKIGWVFDWKYELNQPEREVYKLIITENANVIQGLISLEIKFDHVYMCVENKCLCFHFFS